MRLSLTFLLLASIMAMACQKKHQEQCTSTNGQLFIRVNYACGTAVDYDKLWNDPIYETLVREQFNSITAENIMKPENLHPGPDTFNWTEADQLISYCENNGIRVHGHTLIWHEQLPGWIENFQGTSAQWDTLLKNHVFNIVNHFKGKVLSWDVVNEAFDEEGFLRSSVWKENIGPSYIEKAFRYAHQADPEALLFYNDFSLALNPKKRKAVLALLNQLRAKGVPIDGIGMQMHIFNGFPEMIEIVDALDELWKSDYLIHFSELDISINPFGKNLERAPKKELERQAEKYLSVFQAYSRIPEQYQYGITIWGVRDSDSWIPSFYDRDDFPLLFDETGLPKPAYCKLIQHL